MPATDEYWRSLPRMHKVFAGSALLLLLSTLLMMYKDESRAWRKYQIQAEEFRIQRIDRQLADLDQPEAAAEITAAQERVQAAREQWEAQASALRQQEEELTELQGRVQVLARDSKALNAIRDKVRADYDIAVRDQVSEANLRQQREEFQRSEEAAKLKALELEQVQARHQELRNALLQVRRELDDAEAEFTQALASETSLREQRELLRPTNFLASIKRRMKEWPIINAFNPHLRIQYDWASGLEQTLGMTRVSRVDRCRTCHVNVNDFAAGNIPNYPCSDFDNPYRSHPNPDLFLTATSPHPIDSFGCTICHGGDGSGTTFQNAEHTPPNPAVAHAWAKEHNWHSNHFWEHPMFPRQFIEASCLRCHHSVVELGINDKFGASAPKVFQGYELIRDYGCFGCHEINGFDGDTPIGPDLRLEPQTAEEAQKYANDPGQIAGRLRKVGPSLRHIATKSTPEFIAYWTAEPRRFRPTTRMPQFFDLSNQHDALAGVLQPVELAAVSAYLMDKSQPLELLQPEAGYEPNPERGKDLFSQRGCLACHSKGGEEFVGVDADFGPDLSRIHEKLKGGEEGFQWLYSWIKEPSRYHTRTRMPDLFLDPYQDVENGTTVDPAADIAAYLLQGGPTAFPALAEITSSLGLILDPDFSPEKARQLGIPESDAQGVLVQETITGSPADRAEEQRGEVWLAEPLIAGDVITAYNGQTVNSAEQFAELESQTPSGEMVTLTLLRNGHSSVVRTRMSTPLDDLVRLYLSKSMTRAKLEEVFETRRYPVTEEMFAEGRSPAEFIKGDDVELAPRSFDEQVSEEDWNHRKRVFVGRRTVSRYGCYGCHDIPEFETARPIGTALQDWGVKDTSKLAYEHIHEYLHHHGEPDGSSTAERLEQAVRTAEGGGNVLQTTLTEAELYHSVITHGRAGFLWQKLRDPRSYDYRKTETKGWDERLRMPKFPFQPEQIEAVTTFVLGLVADPPAPAYQFRPEGDMLAKIEGERLLTKYNCAGCHILDMPVWEFGIDPDDLFLPELAEADVQMFEKYKHLKPPMQGATGKTLPTGEPILRATGYPQQYPDPEEDPEFQLYSFVIWDPVDLEDGRRIMPGQPIPLPVPIIHSQDPGRGGDLAHWLIPRLPGNVPGVKDLNEAWQAAPPPLVGQGRKVQTPWLYSFLKNPEQLRYTTVLRMPKFNLDDDEAQALANYFAARDGAVYPYQSIPEKQPDYQLAEQAAFAHEFPQSSEDFLATSWLVLNGPLCRKCHSVGGNAVTATDPAEVKRGPNLQRVENRLRSDYVRLWVYNPKWILPYTSMPANFPPGAESATKELFGGDNLQQAKAVVDALFNYSRLIEMHGPTTYDPPEAPTENPAAGSGNAPAAGGAE